MGTSLVADPALVLLVAGLIVLATFVATVLVHGRHRRSAGMPSVPFGRLFWGAIFGLALVDVAFAGAKLVYPNAELQLTPLVDLLKAAFWPVAFIIFVSYFVGPISTFLEKMTSADLDIAGYKIKLESQVEKASAALTVAAAKSTEAADGDGKATSIGNIASLARAAVSNMALVAKSRPPRILWVDDMPANNMSLTESFEAVGMRIDKALDTDDGVLMLERAHYDLIIEDMGRPSDKDAGYKFLDALHSKNIATPVIIFASRMGYPNLRDEAISRGAIAATNRPTEVFRLVTSLAPRLAATSA
jgi:CheY-like chemotaxis protein